MVKSRREFLLAGAALAAALPVAARGGAPGQAGLSPSVLDAILRRAVDSGQTPGIAVAAWRGERMLYAGAAGLANLETRTPVGPGTVFRIGSLAKQFTAALSLVLEAEGRLQLDRPVRDYLPFLAAQEPFSLRELLQHTAGIRDGDYDAPCGAPATLAERIAAQQPLFDFPPGTAWRYSNANYLLAGAVIEAVSGQSLAEAARQRLFGPLGLADTAFDAADSVVPGRASGYTPGEAPGAPFRNAAWVDVGAAGAAGGMRSTAADLARWHHALFDGHTLPAGLRARMLAPGRLRDGRLAGENRFLPEDSAMGATQYGLGLMLDVGTRDGAPVATHHGGIDGFAAWLATHTGSGLGYACLCNVDTRPGLPAREIRRSVLGEVLVGG